MSTLPFGNEKSIISYIFSPKATTPRTAKLTYRKQTAIFMYRKIGGKSVMFSRELRILKIIPTAFWVKLIYCKYEGILINLNNK